MDLKKLFKHTQIKKAPSDFSKKLMVKIESEYIYPERNFSHDLLSSRQKIYIVSGIIFTLISIFFIPQGDQSSTLYYVFDPIIRSKDKFIQQIAVFEPDINLSLILSGMAFIVISYLSLDMIIRKGIRLSTK